MDENFNIIIAKEAIGLKWLIYYHSLISLINSLVKANSFCPRVLSSWPIPLTSPLFIIERATLSARASSLMKLRSYFSTSNIFQYSLRNFILCSNFYIYAYITEFIIVSISFFFSFINFFDFYSAFSLMRLIVSFERHGLVEA